MMICIGESILALILIDFKRKYEFYMIVFTAFLTMYLILLVYVRSDAHPETHALAEGQFCGSILWVMLHGLAAYFLLGMGVGYKMILPYADLDTIGWVERYTVCYSLAGVLVCMMFIRAAHKYFALGVTFIPRILVIAAAPAIGHFFESPIIVAESCLAITAVTYAYDLLFINTCQLEVEPEYRKKGQKGVHAPLLEKGHDNRRSRSSTGSKRSHTPGRSSEQSTRSESRT